MKNRDVRSLNVKFETSFNLAFPRAGADTGNYYNRKTANQKLAHSSSQSETREFFEKCEVPEQKLCLVVSQKYIKLQIFLDTKNPRQLLPIFPITKKIHRTPPQPA